MNQSIPATAPPPVSPPAGGGGGFFPPIAPPEAPIMSTKPKKGGLPIGVIAALQGIYAKEKEEQLRLQGLDKPLALKPGWGGQGT